MKKISIIIVALLLIAILCSSCALFIPENNENDDNSYSEAYNEGYDRGYVEGFDNGIDIGFDDGYERGITEGWRDDNIEDVGEYFACDASDYVRDRCDFHPLDEAIYIIDDYKNGDPTVTREEYDEAVRSIVVFCEYFNTAQYSR